MDSSSISKKMLSSFLTLTFRRAALLAINFITINVLLARILPVSTIGVFNIANSVLTFFAYFSDIGLAAALIQKKNITEEDLKTTFTIQELLALVIFIAIFFAAPFLANFYSLDTQGMWLIRALGASFLLTSFKVIPSVLFERDLEFGKLVRVELVEAIVFNTILVVLSFQNYGIAAFSYAVLARSVVGVVVIYMLLPRKISLGFSKESARALLNFGVPFQANSLLALVKDRLLTLVVARIIGTTGVGFVTWSQGIAFIPLEVMNVVTRITFPTYSRLQDQPEALKATVERSISLTAILLYPMLFGIAALAPSLINHVVSVKWQPALPLIYLFLFGAFWASLSVPSTNLLNAIGHIKTTLKLMVMWTLLEWGLTPVLTHYIGFYGVGVTYGLVSITSLIPVIIIKRRLNIAVWENIKTPLLTSVMMGAGVFVLANLLVTNFIGVLVLTAIGGLFYIGLLMLFAREKIQEIGSSFKR